MCVSKTEKEEVREREGGRKRQREADIKEAKTEDYNAPLFS